MAETIWIYSLLVSSAWILAVNGLQSTSSSTTCSDAEIYMKQDWSIFSTCCAILYPNETCPIACPCRNGADCVPDNSTCVCKPGWVGSQCERSCRDDDNNTYGVGCKRNCRCGPDATCDSVIGVCECTESDNCAARCPRNRYGPKCRKKCRCKIGGCDHVTGVCNVADDTQSNCECLHGGSCPCPCPAGFYGEACSTPCGCRANETCSRATGLCNCAAESKYPCTDRCPDGFYGPRCSFLCNCPIGLTCNQWTGDCECAGNDSCHFMLLGKTTELKTEAGAVKISTNPTPIAANQTTTGGMLPSQPSTHPHTGQNAEVTGTGSTTRPAAVKRGVGPATDGGPSTLGDEGAVGAGTGFNPTGAFWAVVGAIAALLMVVVVLLLLILRRQITNSRSALTRHPKEGRQDNVYETVEELGKSTSAEAEPACPPPPLPNMFQRGGSTKSSVRGYHRRPLSVHSPLPTMDAPLPASVAAMVCDYGPGTAPAPGGTSRRSLMAEWRPHSQLLLQGALRESRTKSRSQSSLVDEPAPTDRSGKALSCIYNGGITIEDDYADPFDSISPTGDMSNRPPGYLPKLFGMDRDPSSPPPVSPRGGSPMTVQRPDSPMTVQRCESPMAVSRSSSLMNFQRSQSPLAHQLNRQRSDPNMTVQPTSTSPLRRGIGSSSSCSPQRQSVSPESDPVYFTLEEETCGSPSRLPSGINGPDDDYDEMEPSHPINSPNSAILLRREQRSTSRTSSERSRGSSRGSVSTNSPTLGSPFGSSPRDADMFPVSDHRPQVPQRPLSSNVYESCGPPKTSPPAPLDDHGIYSKLNRQPAPWSDLPMSPPRGLADADSSTYGRLQRSYSAKNPPRNADLYAGPYGPSPQRSRSTMVKSQHMSSSADCVASEWVPADPRPRLPPRASKSPVFSEPRKKSRWSIKSKRQLTKKSSSEEMEYDGSALPYPADS